MSKEYYHIQRVAKEIHKKISFILQNIIQDPRIGIVTITDVIVSRDLSYAKIFVTFLNYKKNREIKCILRLLQSMSGLIRTLIQKYINLRYIPKLIFIYDGSLLHGIKMFKLLDEIRCKKL
ncbi:MAG: 30S ribosome binding factor [Candidatus Westeberhardia cardiocondylae]|nr:30S ribosome binding factor [Candidatus Westeberhardia cardiocondylae]